MMQVVTTQDWIFNMAGLDSIQKYEDGGEVAVKANAKGQPVVAGTVPLDPTQTDALLKNMQEMLDQRTGPMATFLSGLKDASAWTAGGAQGPSAALAERDRVKLQEMQDLQNIRNQMAMYKSAGAQQEAAKAQLQGLTSPGGTGGASPIPGLSDTQFNAVANDPLVKQRLAAVPAWDYTSKLAIINEAAKTEFGAQAKGRYEAAGNKQEMYSIPGVGMVQMTPNEFLMFQQTRKLPDGRTVPVAGGAPTAAPVTNAPTATTVAPVTNAPTAAPVARPAAPVAAPTAAPVVAGTPSGGMPQLKDYASKQAYDAAVEVWKSKQQEQQKTDLASEHEERQQAGKLVSNIETRAAKGQETIDAANRVINHAKDHPEEFAYGKQSNVRGGVLSGLGTIPYIGGGLEKGGERLTELAQGAGSRRDVTNSDASKLGFEFANEVFAGSGARLGVGLEQMAAKAKGVGTEHTAETNLLNATLIRIAAEKAKAQSEAWGAYKAAAKAKGITADPYDFVRSPQNKAIEADAEAKLKKDLPQFFNDKTIAESQKRGATGTQKRPLSDFNKKG